TEPRLAHLPSHYKQRIGFTDRRWSEPGSPLHEYLREKRPDAIIAVGTAATEGSAVRARVLDSWRLVETLGPGGARPGGGAVLARAVGRFHAHDAITEP